MPPEETSSVSGRDALDYATRDEMLKRYGVLVAGWVGMLVGRFVTSIPADLFAKLVGTLVVLAGAFAFLVGPVAIVHKLLVES
jgi:hypothetical protein